MSWEKFTLWRLSLISWQKCTNQDSFSWFCCRDPNFEHFEEQVLAILTGLTELGWGVAGGEKEVTTWQRLCAEQHLWPQCCRNGFGCAGCETETWRGDCPVSPWRTVPVCLSQSKVTGNVRLQCKASLKIGMAANSPQAGSLNKSQDWDYSEGWKNLSFVSMLLWAVLGSFHRCWCEVKHQEFVWKQA